MSGPTNDHCHSGTEVCTFTYGDECAVHPRRQSNLPVSREEYIEQWAARAKADPVRCGPLCLCSYGPADYCPLHGEVVRAERIGYEMGKRASEEPSVTTTLAVDGVPEDAFLAKVERQRARANDPIRTDLHEAVITEEERARLTESPLQACSNCDTPRTDLPFICERCAYEGGAQDERSSLVAWLRERTSAVLTMPGYSGEVRGAVGIVVAEITDAIERGDHAE